MDNTFELTIEVTNEEAKEIMKLIDKLRSPAPSQGEEVKQ